MADNFSIKSIHIKNYRSIQDATFEFNQGLNAMLGPNNVGKSNVLEIIKTCLGNKWLSNKTFSKDDIYLHNDEASIVVEIIFTEPLSYKKYKSSPQTTEIYGIKFEYKKYLKGEEKGTYHLDQKCLDEKGKEITSIPVRKEDNGRYKYEPLTTIPTEIKDVFKVIYLGLPRTIESQLPSSQYSFLRLLFQDICAEIEQNAEKKQQYNKLCSDIIDLLSTEQFQKIGTLLKELTKKQLGIKPTETYLDININAFSPFTFLSNLSLILKEGDFEINATQVGQGIQNALVLSIMQVYENLKKEGALILIEEPESFLHPHKQNLLYNTLRELSTKNQVIYTTHSPHFVALPNVNEILRLKKDSNGTKVDNIRNAEWKTICEELYANQEEIKLLRDFNIETREFFFAKQVVFVEGNTEKLALPIYAQQLGKDFDLLEVAVVNVMGKNNLYNFIRIAQSLNIKTFVLYDRDAKDIKNNQELNTRLDSLSNENTVVKSFKRDYETELRDTIGEEEYLRICDLGKSKIIRAVFVAKNSQYTIPPTIREILEQIN